MFYYVPHPLIDRTPGNDATSLTTYTTHTRASGHKNINIYIYSSNPWESNHRDGPTGHNNILYIFSVGDFIFYMYTGYTHLGNKPTITR